MYVIRFYPFCHFSPLGGDQNDQEVQDRDWGWPHQNSARNSNHVLSSAPKHHPHLWRYSVCLWECCLSVRTLSVERWPVGMQCHWEIFLSLRILSVCCNAVCMSVRTTSFCRNPVCLWEYCLSVGTLSVGNTICLWERCLSVWMLPVCGNAVCLWERCLTVGMLSVCGNAVFGNALCLRECCLWELDLHVGTESVMEKQKGRERGRDREIER